tara:strand:- start:2046 stop:2294 length:249 start_codon:yes stop_codon:yes gene_type:complete
MLRVMIFVMMAKDIVDITGRRNMIELKAKRYTGHSKKSISDAIQNALKKADVYHYFEIIEAQSSRTAYNRTNYQVLLAALIR